jgi:TolB-like protein
MTEERVQRRLAAILAADVVGYSRLMGGDEEGTLSRMKTLLNDVIEPKINEYSGRIFKTTGDGFLADFSSAVDAVRFAVDVQRAMAGLNTGSPEDSRIVFRIGISLGDVMVDGDDLFGNGVNVAARMEGLAESGGICVSGNVQEHIGNALDVSVEDLGEQLVKNIDRPVRCYRVHLESGRPSGEFAQTPKELPSIPDKPSIAVLPFQNMSGDADQEYFSDGISEDIITALSRIRQFFVVARNTTFSFKDKAVDVQAVARDLGVRFVLEGSVRKVGKRVRITAQLIDGETGNHIWAERYDRGLDDIFEIQDEITLTVVGTIEPELSRFEQERARRKPVENLDAWDLYQQGLWHLWRRSENDNAEALKLFSAACERDPEFSAAYAHLAYAYFQLYTFHPTHSPNAAEDAFTAAQKAISLDDRDALAHWAMGGAYLLRGEYAHAAMALNRAIDINPSLAVAYLWLAEAYSETDENPERAFDAIDTALRLSPRDPLEAAMLYIRSKIHFKIGQYEDSENWARRSLQRTNTRPVTYLCLLASLGHLNKLSEVAPVFNDMIAHFPHYAVLTEDFLMEHRLLRSKHLQNQLLEGLRKAGVLDA